MERGFVYIQIGSKSPYLMCGLCVIVIESIAGEKY